MALPGCRSRPSSRHSSADIPEGRDCPGTGPSDAMPQAKAAPNHMLWVGKGWLGAPGEDLRLPWWVGWQWLSVIPDGLWEVLTQHKCPESTPHPLSMNQLNHSTEKLTQTHRHPSNPQKVTGRCMPEAEAAGPHPPHPSPGGPAPGSLRNTYALKPRKPRTFRRMGRLHFACLPYFALCWQNLLSRLLACVWSVLPGFTYQVLIVLLGCSRSGWARGMHKMTKRGIFAFKELKVRGAGVGESST